LRREGPQSELHGGRQPVHQQKSPCLSNFVDGHGCVSWNSRLTEADRGSLAEAETGRTEQTASAAQMSKADSIPWTRLMRWMGRYYSTRITRSPAATPVWPPPAAPVSPISPVRRRQWRSFVTPRQALALEAVSESIGERVEAITRTHRLVLMAEFLWRNTSSQGRRAHRAYQPQTALCQ